MSQDKSKDWYLLTSKPRQDAYAEEQLNDQGYTTYRPIAMRERRRQGNIIKVTESLFPRYIFIRLSRSADNWAPISSIYGISNFVQFGDFPLNVSDSLILELQRYESQFGERAIDLDRFQRGDLVTISSGPLQGVGAIFERYSGEERTILLMNVLNKQAKVAVSSNDISKAG